jgi:hypothetical protein
MSYFSSENVFLTMELFDFNTLPLQYQAQFTWDNGVFLATRQTSRHIINLYYTKKFFVEVYFSIKNEGVDMICSFTNIEQLEPYIDQIDIGQL